MGAASLTEPPFPAAESCETHTCHPYLPQRTGKRGGSLRRQIRGAPPTSAVRALEPGHDGCTLVSLGRERDGGERHMLPGQGSTFC